MHWFIEKIKPYYPKIISKLKPIISPGYSVTIPLNSLESILSIIEFGGILVFNEGFKDKFDIDSGFVLSSSGTTGDPKSVLYSFDGFLNKFKNVGYNPVKTIMIMGLDHIGGMDVYFSVISRGGLPIFPIKNDPDSICEIIENEKIEFISLTPTYLNTILMRELYNKYNLSSLKTINFGAEPMTQSLLKRLQNVFPKANFKQTYGTTETGTLEVERHPENPLLIKIKDSKIIENKLYVKSKSGMIKYLNKESPFIDGYFPTGDVVELHDDYLKIIGRESEIVNIGGYKVIPSEVEEILLGLSFVKDVSVYSEKNTILGNILIADIVWDSSEKLDSFEKIQLIKNYLKDLKINKHKIPSKIKIVEELKLSNRMKKIRC